MVQVQYPLFRPVAAAGPVLGSRQTRKNTPKTPLPKAATTCRKSLPEPATSLTNTLQKPTAPDGFRPASLILAERVCLCYQGVRAFSAGRGFRQAALFAAVSIPEDLPSSRCRLSAKGGHHQAFQPASCPGRAHPPVTLSEEVRGLHIPYQYVHLALYHTRHSDELGAAKDFAGHQEAFALCQGAIAPGHQTMQVAANGLPG